MVREGLGGSWQPRVEKPAMVHTTFNTCIKMFLHYTKYLNDFYLKMLGEPYVSLYHVSSVP